MKDTLLLIAFGFVLAYLLQEWKVNKAKTDAKDRFVASLKGVKDKIVADVTGAIKEGENVAIAVEKSIEGAVAEGVSSNYCGCGGACKA